jgi:hypothetical protein
VGWVSWLDGLGELGELVRGADGAELEGMGNDELAETVEQRWLVELVMSWQEISRKKKAKVESLLTSSPCHSTPTISSTLIPDVGTRKWKRKEKDEGNRKKESHQSLSCSTRLSQHIT